MLSRTSRVRIIRRSSSFKFEWPLGFSSVVESVLTWELALAVDAIRTSFRGIFLAATWCASVLGPNTSDSASECVEAFLEAFLSTMASASWTETSESSFLDP